MMVLFALLVAAPGTSAPPAPRPAPPPAAPPVSGQPAAAQPPSRPLAPLAMMPPRPAIARAAVARQARPPREQVLAAVRAEWPRYDIRRTGKLGPLEFSTWVLRANGVAVAPAGARKAAGVKPVTAMNAASRAFAVADADHDGGVTPEEMAAFLMR